MTGSNEVINPEMIFPECQKRHIFMLLMCAGGFMGAFTYILRGGVFCNAQTTINFIASMQYNTFRQARNIPMATTFCTNHLRQTGIYIRKWVKTKNSETGKRILIHLAMIGIFVAGCIICTLLCPVFKGKAIWGAEIPLAIVFIDLLNADIKEAKSQTVKHK